MDGQEEDWDPMKIKQRSKNNSTGVRGDKNRYNMWSVDRQGGLGWINVQSDC